MIYKLLGALALVVVFFLGNQVGYTKGYTAGVAAEQAVKRDFVVTSKGVASWYGPGFHGRRASDGSTFDQNKLTAAHRFLPFGTRVRVINLQNKKEVTVTITDRGPYIGKRSIDLSLAAAKKIQMVQSGLASVRIVAEI